MPTDRSMISMDPSTAWWGSAWKKAAAVAARPIPRTAFAPEPPRIALALALAILPLFLSVLGPVAWIVADRELARMERGLVSSECRGWFVLTKLVGVFTSFVLGMLISVVLAMVIGHA